MIKLRFFFLSQVKRCRKLVADDKVEIFYFFKIFCCR